MSSFRSGLPTPTENWDDDFDFDPLPLPPPSSTSSRTTSSTHPKLLDIVQHEEVSSFGHGGKPGNQPRVVEPWDDDFDYDPMDWTKNIKGLATSDSGAGFVPSYTTSKHPRTATEASQTIILSRPRAGESTSSLVSDKTTSRIPNDGAAHQRSFSSMASQSTAHSERRDRKRSSRFPSQTSSTSLNVDQHLHLAGSNPSNAPNDVYPDAQGKSFDISRDSLDSKASSTRKLRKSRAPTEEGKEGTFRKRVASIRRRISGSLSTGPSTVTSSSKSRDASDMPPPPVPASAFRTSSLTTALPILGNPVTGMPRLSSEGYRATPGNVRPTSSRRSSRRESENADVQGLPTSTSRTASASQNQRPKSRNISGTMSSVSGSSLPVSKSSDSIVDGETEGTAISPASPLGTHLTSPFPSPSPSITSLGSHTGGYGFHLPSPAAGSAYNMSGVGQDTVGQRREVSSSSANSGYGAVRVASDRVGAGVSPGVAIAEDEEKTPKARRVSERPAGRRVSRPSLRSNPSGSSPSLVGYGSNTKPISQAVMTVKTPGRTDSDASVPTDTDQVDVSKHTHSPVISEESIQSKVDNKAMSDFRFGRKASTQASISPALSEAPHRPLSVASSTTAALNQGGSGKTRLALRRIGSISRRHSRRISDGWRAVSGQSSSPAKIQSSRPDSGSTRSADVIADQDLRTNRPSSTVIRQSSINKPDICAAPSTSGTAPDDRTLGGGTATPPRPVLLSPARMYHGSHPSSTPPAMQLTPTAMRSLSQNDSPSTSKIGMTMGEVPRDSTLESRPASNQRRNSLGDLKIPSRVVSAQKGLKEEIGAMKQFAAGVQDLKALMAQRTILQAKQERLGITDTFLESEYSQWWSLADLLIQLGETGSLDGNSGGGMAGIENYNDLRRERRITLAADTVLPPSHLSRLANNDENSVGNGSRSSLSESTDFGMSPLTAGGNGRISSLWRASTGRTDFSSSQLEQLRVILDKPRTPLSTIVDNSVQVRMISLPSSEPETPVSGATPLVHAVPVEGLPRSRTTANVSQYALGVRASEDTHRPPSGQRKSSRSTMGTLRDFWRGAGGSQRLEQAGTPRVVSSKQLRPSLGSIFRRSSQKVPSPLQVQSDERNGGNDPKEGSSVALSTATAPDDDSQTSSVSDWDTPPPETRPSGKAGMTPSVTVSKPPPGDDVTITRSDSRKMLAALGRGHSPSVDGKGSTLSPIRSEFQIPAFSSPPGGSRELDPTDERIPLALTPASLPALVDKLRDVTEHCRMHIDTASKRLKS